MFFFWLQIPSSESSVPTSTFESTSRKMWQFELWTKGKANYRSKIQNGKYGINVVSHLLCLHVEDMWCTILKETNVFIIEWMWISCRIEMIEQSPKRVEIGTHKNPYWKRRHEKVNLWRLTFIWVVSFSSRDNVLLWRRISLLWLLSLWLPLRLLPQRSRLWLPFWLCRCLRNGQGWSGRNREESEKYESICSHLFAPRSSTFRWSRAHGRPRPTAWLRAWNLLGPKTERILVRYLPQLWMVSAWLGEHQGGGIGPE